MKVSGDGVVPSKINDVEARTARIAAAPSVKWRSGNSDQAAGLKGASDADVHLTGAARSLAAIEQSARALPAVDEARVAAVKQRLAGGDYEVDPQHVADRLLRLEGDLRRALPFDKNSPG
jgi:negative regulator of flagellin synthesis FlgM